MEPILGQIIMFGGNFAPRGWALCDGQLLAISQYQALFSLLGTTYGGNGTSTFALPDLRGRAPMHAGSGPGLTPRRPGEKPGLETVTLKDAEIPPHSHSLNISDAPGNSPRPAGAAIGTSGIFASDVSAMTELNAASIGNNGGGKPHDNVQPSLCVNFIIALEGIYPSRN